MVDLQLNDRVNKNKKKKKKEKRRRRKNRDKPVARSGTMKINLQKELIIILTPDEIK